jgi:hypothetical protein
MFVFSVWVAFRLAGSRLEIPPNPPEAARHEPQGKREGEASSKRFSSFGEISEDSGDHGSTFHVLQTFAQGFSCFIFGQPCCVSLQTRPSTRAATTFPAR